MAKDTPPDPVLQQLRKLREGTGLTSAKLERSGAVMSALGTADPKVAMERLQQAVDDLGDSDRVRALKVDFGLDMPNLLEREPATREREWLGDRREGYGQVVERDSKTLGRWSDKAIEELRGQLLADTFTGHLYVMAAVEDGLIKGISLVREDLDQPEGVAKRSSLDFTNPSEEASIPALIYGYPRDWRPASLTLAVSFLGSIMPQTAWAVAADNFFSVLFGVKRHHLIPKDGTVTCRFERLRTDRLYAIAWANSHDR